MEKKEIVLENGRKIIIADSISFVKNANEGDIIVCGSHGGKSVIEYIYQKNLVKIGGLIVNDAGVGKNRAGIIALDELEKLEIPVVAVSSSSAMIGDGVDVYENGVISYVNSIAMEKGVRPGMKANEAALIFAGLKPKESPIRYLYSYGGIAKIAVIRLRPGSDLILSLENYCKENDIKTAIIVNAIGSLRRAKVLLPVVINGNVRYTEPKEFDGPLEFLSGQGFVMEDKDGELFVHMHGTFSDNMGRAYGGHLNKEGNIVLATLDITLMLIENIKLKRLIDKEVNIGTMWIF